MTVRDLPALNALLNGASACFLAFAYAAVKSGRIQTHRTLMLCALASSAVFLASYLVYHSIAGHVAFQGRGAIRAVYFTILLTHTVLAVVNVPLIARTLFLAWRGRFEEHSRLAAWVWPSWMYVSMTGVLVYWMLYRL